jgi:hypothetical protein
MQMLPLKAFIGRTGPIKQVFARSWLGFVGGNESPDVISYIMRKYRVYLPPPFPRDERTCLGKRIFFSKKEINK